MLCDNVRPSPHSAMANQIKRSPTTNAGDARRILNSIRQLVRALRLFDREAQTRYGISAAQMFILHALAGEEEAISLNELADRTATDQSSASVVVQRLVEAGYVSRTPRKEDRRHIDLRLTPKGRAIVRRSPPPAQEKIVAAVETMSAPDRRQLAELLETFVGTFAVRGKNAPMLFEDEPKPRRGRG
jgi:DNA-binding MarR family transcriptional regulator